MPPKNDKPVYDLATDGLEPIMKYTFDQAKEGNTVAQNIMAEYYIAKNNLENAIPFYKMAAEGGNLDGIGKLFTNIGYAYEAKYRKLLWVSGKTKEQLAETKAAEQRSMFFFKIAADIGNAGGLYEMGDSNKKNDVGTALKYYKMALSNNHDKYYYDSNPNSGLSMLYWSRQKHCDPILYDALIYNKKTFYDVAECYDKANSLQNALIKYELFIENNKYVNETTINTKTKEEEVEPNPTKSEAEKAFDWCDWQRIRDPYDNILCYNDVITGYRGSPPAKKETIKKYENYISSNENSTDETIKKQVAAATERIPEIKAELKNECVEDQYGPTELYELAQCYGKLPILQKEFDTYNKYIEQPNDDAEKLAEAIKRRGEIYETIKKQVETAKTRVEAIKATLKADCEDNQFTDMYELAQCYEAKNNPLDSLEAYRNYKKFIKEPGDTDETKIETAKERLTEIYKDLKAIALEGLNKISSVDIETMIKYDKAIKPEPLKGPNPEEGGRKITRRQRRQHQHKTKKRKPKTKKYKSSQLKKRTRKRSMH